MAVCLDSKKSTKRKRMKKKKVEEIEKET